MTAPRTPTSPPGTLIAWALGLWIACSGTCSAAPQKRSRKVQDSPLKLTVETKDRTAVGLDIPLTVHLETGRTRKVFTLDTASLQLTLSRFEEGTEQSVLIRTVGGSFRQKVVSSGGNHRVIREPLEQRSTELQPGERISHPMSLYEVFRIHLFPGKYRLKVVYEREVSAEAWFDVAIEYDKTVPALIELLDQGDLQAKQTARLALVHCTGLPRWKPRADDDRQKVQQEVDRLRQWWAANRDLILHVERALRPPPKQEADTDKKD